MGIKTFKKDEGKEKIDDWKNGINHVDELTEMIKLYISD